MGDDVAEQVLQKDDDTEDHRGCTDNGGTDEHGFCRGFKGVARTVCLFEVSPCAFSKSGSKPKCLLISALMFGTGFRSWKAHRPTGRCRRQDRSCQRQIVTGPMPRKPKATRPKAKTGAAKQNSVGIRAMIEAMLGYEIGDEHENQDCQAFPEGREVTGDETGEDIQGCAAVTRGADDFLHVAGFGARKDLGEFRDQRACDGTAADDDGKCPPDGPGYLPTWQIAEEQVARPEGDDDRDASR